MNEETKWMNHYVCSNCNYWWADVWTGTVDMDCPRCEHRHVTPYASIPLEQPPREGTNAADRS